jgi:hypothetical protein
VTGVSFLTVMEHIAPQPNVWDRLVARVRARRLDWALANGADSEQSAAIALRARRLTSLSRRRVIANSLWRVLRDGCVAADGRHELAGLAAALQEPGPVAPRGAARAWLLVTDARSPLHGHGNLRGYAASARRQLTPRPV